MARNLEALDGPGGLERRRQQRLARNRAIREENRIEGERNRLDRKFQEDFNAFLERTTQSGGARAGLRELKTELGDIGTVTRDSIVEGFRLAEQAMLDFFSTGEIGAKDLLRDLARLGIQLGIRGLTSSFFPSTFTPGAANGADFIVPGFANGGSGRMRAANSSDQVPVFFLAQPGERVIVETPQQQERSPFNAQQAPPIINNQVVVSPSAMLDVVKSPAGIREVKNIVAGMADSGELRRALRQV